MDIKVYRSITDIDEKEWDAVAGRNRIICTHNYLEAVEKSEINDCSYYYPVVYEKGDIVAHASAYSISTELDTFVQGFLKRMIGLTRRVWKNFLIVRFLECGTPVAIGNTISFKPGVDRVKVMKLLAGAMEDLAREIGVKTILFRDFYDQELLLFDSLKDLGYNKIKNLPTVRMRIRWGSFREYLNSMRARYKRKIVKQRKLCCRDNVSLEVLRDFSKYSRDLERLWSNVYARAKEYRRERLTARFFENIDSYLGNRAILTLVKKGSLPIGFMLMLVDERTLIPFFCGLDYRYNEEYAIYFNLFSKAVEIAIDRGLEDIEMGITTLTPKKNLGGVVTALNMYLKHLNPLAARIIPKLFDVTIPKEDLGSRNVFR